MNINPAYLSDGRVAYPSEVVKSWSKHNQTRMILPLYDQATLDTACEIIEQLIACHEEPACPAVAVAQEWLKGLSKEL